MAAMSDNNIEDTQEIKKSDPKSNRPEDEIQLADSALTSKNASKAPQNKRWKWALGLILLMILFIVLGGRVRCRSRKDRPWGGRVSRF